MIDRSEEGPVEYSSMPDRSCPMIPEGTGVPARVFPMTEIAPYRPWRRSGAERGRAPYLRAERWPIASWYDTLSAGPGVLFLSGLLLLVDARTVARSLRPPFDLTRCCFVAADPEHGVSAVSSGCGPGVSSRFMRMCCGLPCNHVPRSLGKANLVAVDEDDVAVLYDDDDDDDDDDDELPTAPYVVPFAVPFAVRCARRRRRRRALPGRRAWAWSRALLRACSVAHILFSASSACVVDEPRPDDMKLKVFVDCHGWAAMWFDAGLPDNLASPSLSLS